ncbi:KAP family NTPase [Variovorax fucosicus]|uniref:KAP family NTPase n=1 Tax=Variovorax fucosicus TaxID=3053517 RepID=UPI0025755D9D|nr:KAP family NTPase [Variovorax sp. J22G47]MDM0059028.1 KAP family NTPase [Variovorax sp. J22G47]
MKESPQAHLQMPELLVFVKAFLFGLVAVEVFRLAFYLGNHFALWISRLHHAVAVALIAVGLSLCIAYFARRDGLAASQRLLRSQRIDLLFALTLGSCANFALAPHVAPWHEQFRGASPLWAPIILGLLLVMLASPLVRAMLRPRKVDPQLHFLPDDEIKDEAEDVLAVEKHAKSFAETVLASGAQPGLIFGVDGPWGTGKTSFINLAQRYWKQEPDIIVFRFEPLRYAADPDLADRLIRDLSKVIQKEVFAPEFTPVASRYSRMLKGKADISFLGIKLSLEPSSETVDDLLQEIDDALERINRRVIVVVDDLDRLEPKSIDNVLFTARRTFRLSRASYILCYDTEVLARSKDEGGKAREFLEKFVTVKLSLFVDSTSLTNFLRRDWQREENKLVSIPSDTMAALASILETLAEILESPAAAQYLPLVGDMRKIKRFVNALLLVQLEKTNLGRTDFNRRDLVNLMLLHLGYPGVFRQIYAEETAGRSGTFSLKREAERENFTNAPEFAAIIESCGPGARFLVQELFDVNRLGLGERSGLEEGVLRSRACFNHSGLRNLEKYLKLIVRFSAPEPRETFVLYQEAVEEVRNGTPIEELFRRPDFVLKGNADAHDQFWRVLVSQSHDFTREVAEDAIETLVAWLPRYPSLDPYDRGLRQRSIYSLVQLLDRAGWGRTSAKRLPNIGANVVEVARRILGEGEYEGRGLIARLAADDRGVLGWNDLMLFRLQCSADRRGQLHNLHTALIVHDDPNGATAGLLTGLALQGMREISQAVFAHFRRVYVETGRNFLSEVGATPASAFIGEASTAGEGKDAAVTFEQTLSASDQVEAVRSTIKNFVTYQLCNSKPPNGSGVGCGFYDETGSDNKGGISRVMNEYMFKVCFNPLLDDNNRLLFADYCLSNLSNAVFAGSEADGFIPTKVGLADGLDEAALCEYWQQYRGAFEGLLDLDRRVVTTNYVATYGKNLSAVFEVLDEMLQARSVPPEDSNPSQLAE